RGLEGRCGAVPEAGARCGCPRAGGARHPDAIPASLAPGAAVGMFARCRLRRERDQEEIQRVGEAGAENALLSQPTTRSLHLQSVGEFHVADLAEADRNVGILAVELDLTVKSAGLRPGVALQYEIAALHDRAYP